MAAVSDKMLFSFFRRESYKAYDKEYGSFYHFNSNSSVIPLSWVLALNAHNVLLKQVLYEITPHQLVCFYTRCKRH